MTPLDLADLTEPLVVAWLAALIFAASVRVIAWKQGKRTSSPFLRGVLEFLWFGSMITIFGIARQANTLGYISFRLYLFIVFTATMTAACGGAASRLQSPPQA
jgi:hypothetical protein